MQFTFAPDFAVNDSSCLAVTGKTLPQWFAHLEQAGLASKRREAIALMYDETGRGKDTWWATTVWVEFERARGVVQRDGRPEGYNLCCTTSFKRTPAEIYPFFSSEAQVAQWVDGWQGALTAGASFACGPCQGTVGRIRPAKDIRLAWQSPGFGATDVEIQFNEMGGKTTVNIYHKRIASRDEADGLRRAWSGALDKLKGLVG